MKKFEIWSCGWMSSDGSGPEQLLSTQEANTFNEACEKYRDSDKEALKYMSFNATTNKWSYWGCSLHDNRKDAAAAF